MTTPTNISGAAQSALRWSLSNGVGPVLFRRICERFGSAEAALGASASELAQIDRIGGRSADAIAAARDTVNIDNELEAARRHGVHILCGEDAGYPAGLKRIPDPPIVLYLKGELRPEDAVAVAIVGSRKCSLYGAEQARRFGELLAGAGFTVVSGLARGVDAFAHHGALDAGGRTVAVLGNGLHEVYPPENIPLAERIVGLGACLSELPMATVVRGTNFPARNRIIAGMSLGTLVVEAAKRSGALITARLAGEYNREVFAIPGRIDEANALGVNALIRDGAALVSGLDDILDGLGDVASSLRRRGSSSATSPAPSGTLFEAPQPCSVEAAPHTLSEIEQQVFSAIGTTPLLTDEVMSALESPPGDVLAALTALELKGLIRRLPGQRVTRRPRAPN